MFLSLKELKYAKAKFALIIAVVVLISYLVYFLTSLAFGLASSYTNAVTKWGADDVVMTVDANDNLLSSYMAPNDFDKIIVDGQKARLGIFPAVINDPSSDDIKSTRADVYFFGIDTNSFLVPEEFVGKTLNNFEVIADISLEQSGYAIGDVVGIGGFSQQLTIVGFTTKATYQTVPVLYMTMESYQTIRYNQSTGTPYSGVVVKGSITEIPENLQSYSISQFQNNLPGYTAQVLTFTIMIVFLILIVAVVLAIFIYVLTIQKTSMFGVMKAQGISNMYIGSSVVIQTFILVGIGIFVGLILTLISGFFLAGIVPFAINIIFYAVITLGFFLFAFLGALFSVNAVLKIDPLKAIGG